MDGKPELHVQLEEQTTDPRTEGDGVARDPCGKAKRGQKFWRRAYDAASRAAATRTHAPVEREAIVQEAVVRFFVDTRKPTPSTTPVPLELWMCGIVRNVARERIRRRAKAPMSLCESSVPGRASDLPGPEQAAYARELSRTLHSAIATLPEPNRTIAALRVHDVPRSDIASYLREWRGIGPRETRRLGNETLRMLRLALSGADLPSNFPRRFSKKTPWNTSAPPDFGHKTAVREATRVPVEKLSRTERNIRNGW